MKLEPHSIGAKQLKNGAVGTKQLKNGAVSGPKIQTGAVGTNQLANGAVTGGNMAPGAVGIQNMSGPALASLRANAAVGSSGPNPSATPSNTDSSNSATITTTSAGHLLVIADEDIEFFCTGGPCSVDYGLYVDGQPVPGTDRSYSHGTGAFVGATTTIFGLVPAAAGSHTLTVGISSTSGTPSIAFDNRDGTAIVSTQ